MAAQLAATDAGQLFGTFHNSDGGHDGYGSGSLNFSLLDPNSFADSFDYFPCDFGLLSKGGFALVDDTRVPVCDTEAGGWSGVMQTCALTRFHLPP